ncbi:LysM peptidoglycan-binding domain-containing protein [Maritalea sp.]|uniref:LysM peptidoglycan-binding domain-containing protein n=1 Tax=Maritalea sp. TaxID=2003361 RepID=UPI003EF27E21
MFNRGSDEAKTAEATKDSSSEQTSDVKAVEPEMVPAASTQDDTQATDEVMVEAKAPDFTIARAAADGFVVIVGTADVDDTIVVKSNGQILGKTKPENSGEWVFVPENALATGGVEITVEALDAKGNVKIAEKSEIVLIHEGRDKEPIVVASVPGQASDIIQGLSEQPTQVAQVESVPEVAPADTQQTESNPSNDSPIVEQDTPVTLIEPEATPVEDVSEVAEADEPGADETGADKTAVAAEEVVSAEVETTTVEAVVAPAEPVVEVAEDKIKETVPAVPAVEVAAPEDVIEVAKAAQDEAVEAPANAVEVVDTTPEQVEETAVAVIEQPAAQTPDVPVANDQEVATTEVEETEIAAIEAVIQPTIDAIEIDGELNFIAGAGPNGATMRVYVDNKYVADAIVADGRWLIETQNVLTKENQRIRADLLAADTAEVAARTEVNFVIEDFALDVAETEPVETPAPVEEEIIVAEVEQVQPEATSTVEEVAPTTPVEESVVVDKVVEAPTVEIANTTEAETTQPAPVEEAAAEIEVVEEASPVQENNVSADAPATNDIVETAEAVEATVDVAEAEVGTITATSVGEGDEQRFVSGHAIIRKGDNLWTIARRVYGSGIKYTTIYEANSNSISRPELIFPGQVFELPDEE